MELTKALKDLVVILQILLVSITIYYKIRFNEKLYTKMDSLKSNGKLNYSFLSSDLKLGCKKGK